MATQNQPQLIIVQNAGNSAFGTAGLIFSILGWLTCGILSPIGAFLSFLGLFSKKDKTHAVVGIIVGFPGVIFLVFIGSGIVASFLGVGAVATMAVTDAAKTAAEQQNRIAIVEQKLEPTPLPSEIPEPIAPIPIEQSLIPIEPDPEPIETVPPIESPEDQEKKRLESRRAEVLAEIADLEAERDKPQLVREWKSADGKFTTTATLEKTDETSVTLTKADGKSITVPIAKLSESDARFVADVDSKKIDINEKISDAKKRLP
ncbi:MAG: SHD1 domain-containing protein [Pirellulaceae bacterium]|nr:SHD1 domain-containing protein [Pirellulaceae bacterium]